MEQTAAPVEIGGERERQATAKRPVAARGWTWPAASLGERILQATTAVILAGAIGLGLFLTPAVGGTGTHTLLGLAPCGMLVSTGKPCPTCGVTTSFALAAHGRFGEALVNQPFGLALFLLCGAGLVFSVTTAAAGRSWYPLATRWSIPAFIMALVILGLLSWMYKWSTM